MIVSMFVYEGHSVVITQEIHKSKPRYWFSVDGIQIQYASNPDTAKRFVTRFIDVITDSHYMTSQKNPVYKPRQSNNS